MEEARDTDTKLIAFSVFSCLVLGGIMFLASPFFPRLYNTTRDDGQPRISAEHEGHRRSHGPEKDAVKQKSDNGLSVSGSTILWRPIK